MNKHDFLCTYPVAYPVGLESKSQESLLHAKTYPLKCDIAVNTCVQIRTCHGSFQLYLTKAYEPVHEISNNVAFWRV